ncbi:hypothetical protein PENSPDRAFT_654884 [Peniophora sp. CONT]|nr:hypothetical protein PENSPDRAFT_654884 [Peniophora sp. CONT]
MDAVSRVPTEIWLEIFEYASSSPVPNLLDIDIPHPFFTASSNSATDYYELDCLHSALRTKRSLVLVNRSWNSIASELLHQVLLIDSVHACRALCDNIENGWDASTGASVRHLLLGTLCRSSYQYLPTILRKLPNIKILSLWNANIALSEQRIADVMVDIFAHSLLRIHIYGEQLAGPQLATLYDLVHNAPHLRTLIVDCKEIQGGFVVPPLPDLTFVAGHNLTRNPMDALMMLAKVDEDPFPRLEHIHLPARRLFARSHNRAFEITSPSATIATVDLRRDWEVGPEYDLWSGLSALWARCPSLTHVHLVLAWQQFAASDRFPAQLGTCAFALPQSMTHLSVLATFTGTFRMSLFVQCCEALLKSLERVGRSHPALQVVRFTSPLLVQRTRQAAMAVEMGFVKALHDRCSKFFRFEDHLGHPLFPSPTVS